jgi:hypothetical protein
VTSATIAAIDNITGFCFTTFSNASHITMRIVRGNATLPVRVLNIKEKEIKRIVPATPMCQHHYAGPPDSCGGLRSAAQHVIITGAGTETVNEPTALTSWETRR